MGGQRRVNGVLSWTWRIGRLAGGEALVVKGANWRDYLFFIANLPFSTFYPKPEST
jgi:hypothetical protein